MRTSSLLLSTLAGLAVMSVMAFADPAQTTSNATNAAPDPDAVICKSSPPPTGSRLGGGRECHTQRDWDERQKQAERQLQLNQMRGMESCLGSCGN